MEYLFLLSGFALLLLSGNYLVKGGVIIAEYFKISTLVVGLTVVAFGTSAPELLVSFQAALKGHPDISIGNVVGSNIANIALVLGFTAIILPIPVSRSSVKIDCPIMIFASLLFYLFILDREISLLEGAIFVSMIIAYVVWSVYYSKRTFKVVEEEHKRETKSLFIALGFILASSVGLVFGSNLLVENAAVIARYWGVSERVISVSIIALGTSVPELATSVVAAIKKEMDISIGNIIGSNIFNIFAVLGITSVIHPIRNISSQILNFDVFWMLGIAILLFLFILPTAKGTITRLKGFLFVACYSAYIFMIFFR